MRSLQCVIPFIALSLAAQAQEGSGILLEMVFTTRSAQDGYALVEAELRGGQRCEIVQERSRENNAEVSRAVLKGTPEHPGGFQLLLEKEPVDDHVVLAVRGDRGRIQAILPVTARPYTCTFRLEAPQNGSALYKFVLANEKLGLRTAYCPVAQFYFDAQGSILTCRP